MLDFTDEQKRLFYTGGNFIDYVFYFPETGVRITNETIHQEGVTIKESICEEQELTLGGCVASSIEFDVSEIIHDDLTGLEFAAELYVNLNDDGTYDLKVPMGVYRVESAKMVDDKDYKHVVAYDVLYDISIDVSDWYNKMFPDENSKMTLRAVRESLLEFLGVSYKKQTMPNDETEIFKTIEPGQGNITGTSVLKQICTINGGFGRINREGFFEVLNIQGLALFPEETIYPEETLYPEDRFMYLGISDSEEEPCAEYRTTKYEEYACQPPTCVTIKTTEDDFGVTVGNDTRNPYVISGNFLLYGKSAKELNKIAGNILKMIEHITYRPNSTKLYGLPYIETGDVFALQKRNDTVESYVFSRTLAGVQNLIDTYEAKGSEMRANNVPVNEEVIQLRGKMLVLKKSIDGVYSEIEDIYKETKSRFEQTDEKIETEVSNVKGELSSSIEQTAGNIVLKVDSAGNMAEVSLGVDADDPSATKFMVSAKNIELSADEVINLISGGTINLTSSNINIESDNFSVTKDGLVSARSIDITGGTINIDTSYFGENAIRLRNLDIEEAKPGDADYGIRIEYYGEGEPSDETAQGKTHVYYLDLNSGSIYLSRPGLEDKRWQKRGEIGLSRIKWTEIIISTSDGTASSKYNYEKFDVVISEGVIEEQNFKEEEKVTIRQGKIEFSKSFWTARMGNPEQHDVAGTISIDSDYVESDTLSAVLRSDVPIYAPNIYNLDTSDISLVSYLNSAGNFNVYSGQTVRLFRSGNVVEINGAITPKKSLDTSADLVNILSLPSGYEPKSTIVSVQQGSGKHTWTLTVSASGEMSFSRYGIGGYETATNGTWLPFHVTYLI